MSNPKEANFRLERFNGAYRVEVMDKPVGHWYIVASKMTWKRATRYCEEHFGIEPTKKELTARDIKSIVNIADELLKDANAKDKYISEEDYYEEILKRYNNE